MLRIAICDDTSSDRAILKAYIYRSFSAENVEVLEFQSGFELIDRYQQQFDIIFLDVEMPGINGIETAKDIRNFDTNVAIVFVTNFSRYAIEGYLVQAYHYLVKPLEYVRFEKEVVPLMQRLMRNKTSSVAFKTADGLCSVNPNDIIYVESAQKKVKVILQGKEIEIYGTLKELEAKLTNYHFFRIHTSFLVNMQMIELVKAEEVVLKNKIALPLSKHRKKQFLESYMNYVGDLI